MVFSLCTFGNLGATDYYYYDLGTLGGDMSWASGINDSGQIAGYAYLADNYSIHAFLKNPGQVMQDLGTMGGDLSYAYGINNSGQIVGSARATDYSFRAFLKNPGQPMQDLGTLGGYTSSFPDIGAHRINNGGQIVGYACLADNYSIHAFLKNPGEAMQDLGTLGGNESKALSINDSGQITGYAFTAGPSRAFLVNPGQPMQDLGTLGGSWSQATGINDSGQIVGTASASNIDFPGDYYAFLKKPGEPMQNLGALGGNWSQAFGINDSGQVVGRSATPEYNSVHAFLRKPGQTMQDLNAITINLPSGVTLYTANSINNKGQIVGETIPGPSLVTRAFLLTPIEKLKTYGVFVGVQDGNMRGDLDAINSFNAFKNLYNFSANDSKLLVGDISNGGVKVSAIANDINAMKSNLTPGEQLHFVP